MERPRLRDDKRKCSQTNQSHVTMILADDVKLKLTPVVKLKRLAVTIRTKSEEKPPRSPSSTSGITPIKSTKILKNDDNSSSCLGSNVEELQDIIRNKDEANKVLQDKIRFLEDELCEKNALLKKLQENQGQYQSLEI